MAKLITKFKYLKPSARQSVGGYAKYIATREGVEKVDDTFKTDPPTEKQKKLIERILRDFPDSNSMLEYEDYLKEPTLGNASEFITRALEDNANEALNTKTYADYIATRPRAERFGSHGLFTDDGVRVKLEDVSRELNEYEGNVWTVIISLRREDAERLGFNSGERWRDMLRTQTETIAKNFKIPVEDLKWYAAFHNESHHPHVHLMVYSSEQAKPYLTQKGIMNLRSAFAKDVFADDLLSVYEKQTEHRNALRAQSRDVIAEIVSRINSGAYDTTIRWSAIRFQRNNNTYRMLISLCQLILEGMLLTTDSGEYKLASFVDEQRMNRLYEKFILEYYAKECPQVIATASQIPWALDDGIGTMLPVMQSDIMLTRGSEVLIIDAKYYTHTTQTQYDVHTLHSGNLYQIFTYVKNKDTEFGDKPHKVSGMLLYAATDEAIQPDNSYQMSGNKISVKTLDLNRDFSEIAAQLNAIVDEHFAS